MLNELWRLILSVKLTGLRAAQVAGKTWLLGVPVRISIWISRLSKGPPYQGSWASPAPSRTWLEQKGGGRVTWIFFCLSQAIQRLLPLDISTLVLGPSDLDWELNHWPKILQHLDSDWIMPPTFLFLWLTDSRLQDFSASATMWGKSYNKSPYIHLSMPLVLFLWRPPNTWVFWYLLKVGVQGDCLTSFTLCLSLPLGCTELSDCSRDSLTVVPRGEIDDNGLPVLHSPALHWWGNRYISTSQSKHSEWLLFWWNFDLHSLSLTVCSCFFPS